ncbi:protein of unknown function [Streptomyces murinus]
MLALHVQDKAVAGRQQVDHLGAGDHEVLGLLARVAPQFLERGEHRDHRLLGVVQGEEAGGVTARAVHLRRREDLLEVLGGHLPGGERAHRVRERGRGRLRIERRLLAVPAGPARHLLLPRRVLLLRGAAVHGLAVSVHGRKRTEIRAGAGMDPKGPQE